MKSVKMRILKRIYDRFMSWRLAEITAPRFPIMLGYPIDPRPRWGYGKPNHPQLEEIVEQRRDSYDELLQRFAAFVDDLKQIPLAPDLNDTINPCWNNGFFSQLDAIALYGLIAIKKPARIVEVGSGNSTQFARRAILDHQLSTHLTSIDPSPRAEIDAICDEVIRTPLEIADLSVFDRVRHGDFVFIDDSHRSFTNSDATTFFIDVLPHLPSGVFVHVHDIFIPMDYPPEWSGRYYSEQYLLSCYLLGARGGRMPRIVLPNAFVSFDDPLCCVARRLLEGAGLASLIFSKQPFGGIPGCHGTSFWFESP